MLWLKGHLLLSVIFLSWSLVASAEIEKQETLFQVSTIDALLAGAYDGGFTCGMLKEHGEVGIGTFNGLEGELVYLDGTIYQALVDGSVRVVPDSAKVPFAVVSPMDSEIALDVPEGLDMEAFTAWVTGKIGGENYPVAFRMRGTFHAMRVRSVPMQEPPYRPLAEVVEDQAIFELGTIKGTLVGFRTPAYLKGVNVPGYHLHFLSADRNQGGHVLDFRVQHGDLEADRLHQLVLKLPEADGLFDQADLSRDRTTELEKVER